MFMPSSICMVAILLWVSCIYTIPLLVCIFLFISFILKELIAAEVFDLVITLGHSKGIGTVESVYCIKSNSELTKDSFVLQP